MNARSLLLGVAGAAGLLFSLSAAPSPTPTEPSRAARDARKAVLLRDATPGKAAVADTLAEALRKAGLEVRTATLDDTARPGWWEHQDAGFIALPDARRLPAAAKDGLLRFLGQGGKLLCAGAPLLGEPLFRAGDAWRTHGELAAARQVVPVRHVLLDARAGDAARWSRSSNNPGAPSRLSIERTSRGPALRLEVRRLQGWDNFGRVFDAPPFPGGSSLTCFWARSARPADTLAVEWQEQDGSRWIAPVPLTRTWQRCTLIPRDFAYWPDSPTRGARAGPNDHFRPERAVRLVLGFAVSHRADPGDHTAWIADLGTAPDPFGAVDTEFTPLRLEALSPAYKLYPLRSATRLTPISFPLLAQSAMLPALVFPRATGDLLSPIPRHTGIGLTEGRSYRFVPLMNAVDAAGRPRGTPAWLLLHFAEPYPGAAWLVIGTTDERFWAANRPALVALLAGALGHLREGVFLTEGGSDRFTAYAGETMNVGAQVANLAHREATVKLSLRLRAAPGTKDTGLTFDREQTLDLAPGRIDPVRWQIPAPPVGRYDVEVGVQSASAGPTDALAHALTVVERPRVTEADRVTVRGGHFWLHGRRWFALGVNFWPRSAVAREPDEIRRHWLDPDCYDPAVVEQDLRLVRAMGMNCVSVQYTRPEQALPLRDFLRRCSEKGLRVNLYLAGAHPLHLDSPLARRLIEAADLPHQPALFAYDVAWEPVWGKQEERRRYDAEWRAWVLRRYGSAEHAEAVWASHANRDDQGRLTGPTDEQVTHDGIWRAMVADYRRFQDDLLDTRYAAVRRLIHSLDPHPLLGARTGWGGGPFINAPTMPFDHSSGAAQLDFISPEGWNLHEENFEQAALIPAYDRMVSVGKPVFWAEFGESCGYPLGGVTGSGSEADAAGRLRHQADHYERFYRMIRRTDSDGAMAWWLPGGYRVEERSDYGIVNPDGTLRPAGEVIQRDALALTHPMPSAAPEVWLPVDRCADARGAWALWQKYGEQFARMEREGRRVGLRRSGN